MFNDKIFHPVTGEKGYFVSEEQARFIQALLDDFRFNRLSLIEHSTLAEGCDVNE